MNIYFLGCLYMNIKMIFLVFIVSISLYGVETDEGEYSISDLKSGGMSLDSYYDTLAIPDLYVGTKCYKDCKKNCCYSVLRARGGKVLRSYSTSDSVGEVARSRYKDKSYLMYSYTHGPEKDRVTDMILVDNKLKEYPIDGYISGSYDREISLDAKIIDVARGGIYVNGNHILTDTNFESAAVENDYKGNIGVVGVNDKIRSLFVSNLKEMKMANITLASRSDKKGILAVYPSDESVYAVAYNLINIYNKGLMGAKVDFKNNSTKSGWIYNYQGDNIGFYPQIYLTTDSLYVKALNSSRDESVYFQISANEYEKIDKTTPLRDGFENEEMVSFVVGAGLSYLGWYASSEVTDKDDNSFADTEYEIANTLYKKVWLQGRVGDTQLAISYMQNEAEKVGGLTKKASDILSMFVDVNNLISSSSVLRIAYESAKINGIATFNDAKYGATNVTVNSKVEFESKLDRLSLLVMMEKGFYTGFEYTSFETPSAVGFSGSSKNVEYYGLDKNFGITNYEIVAGYDTASYAKRYETDFSKFYIQGLFGFGVSVYDMSSAFKNRVQAISEKKIVNSDFSFVLDAELQFGYLWQQRFKTLKGFGHSFDMGIKARGIYTGAGQSDESDSTIESDELSMEMTRSDIWYGPFINYNIVF